MSLYILKKKKLNSQSLPLRYSAPNGNFIRTRRVDGNADILSHSSASRSHSGCVLHQGMHAIDSRPFHSMTIRPPIPEIQFDLENSRSNVGSKVPQSAQCPFDSFP